MSNQVNKSFRKLPAARALGWVSGSFELIKRQPLRLLLISLFFQFFLSFSQAPAIGLLVILCLPVLSAGMLHAFLLVERGDKPMLAVLFLPFTAKKSVGSLILLGAITMALALLVVSVILAGQMVDIDPDTISRIEQGDLEALQLIDPQMMESALLGMALGAAISGCLTYFSVPLIWFSSYPVGLALLTGLKALGQNWKPLLLIGLLIGVMAVPIGLLFGSFYLSALGGGVASSVLALLLLVFGPLFQLFVFATQYVAFRDIFGSDQAITDVGGQSRDQLVA